jgi:hypothetical protein
MMHNVIPFTVTLNTNGKGLWTDVTAPVRATELVLAYVDDEEGFGELRVHFDTKSWDVNSRGLIYTDPQFLFELKAELTLKGFDTSDISYSEQGMQGDDYVSFDIGTKFITSWVASN